MSEPTKSQKFVNMAFGLFGILVVAGFIGFVLRVLEKIESGRGLETYFTGFGVKFGYIEAAIVVMLIPVTLIVALAIRWWQKKDERDFIEKYGKEKE